MGVSDQRFKTATEDEAGESSPLIALADYAARLRLGTGDRIEVGLFTVLSQVSHGLAVSCVSRFCFPFFYVPDSPSSAREID